MIPLPLAPFPSLDADFSVSTMASATFPSTTSVVCATEALLVALTSVALAGKRGSGGGGGGGHGGDAATGDAPAGDATAAPWDGSRSLSNLAPASLTTTGFSTVAECLALNSPGSCAALLMLRVVAKGPASPAEKFCSAAMSVT